MATWRPPKTSYWVTPPLKVPGGEDFQRSEENIKYLKEQTDGIKSGSIKVGKASQADSAGQVKSGSISLTSGGAGSEAVITHNFDTYNILVSVKTETSGFSGAWEFVGPNSIRIKSTHPGSQYSTMIYRYIIFKP